MGQVQFVNGKVLFVNGRVCMAGYPCCAPKTTCGDCSFRGHDTLGVDLKAGGWTKVWCDICPDIRGEYLLTKTSGCDWEYREDDYCVYWAGGYEYKINFAITARIENNRFKVRVLLQMGIFVLTDYADYQSDLISTAQCFGDFADGRLSLAKVAEGHPTPQCQGSMPNTIELFET